MRGTRRNTLRGPILATAVTMLLLSVATGLFAANAWTKRTVETMNGTVTVNVAGTGRYRVSLTDAAVLPGGLSAQKSAAQAASRPLSLAEGDFTGDGMPDLAYGYATGNGGAITLYRGNADAVYPNSKAARAHRAAGTFSNEPFLPTGVTLSLPFSPDFIAAGDFNQDGHEDILAAAKDGNQLALYAGDGHGGFADAQTIELPGLVTVLASGSFARAGSTDAVVGVRTSSGPELLVYGNLADQPLTVGLPADASAIAFGVTRPKGMIDMAVAAGSDLVVVSGNGSSLSSVQRAMPYTISSVAVGSFTGSGQYEVALLSSAGDVSVLSNGSTAKTAKPLSDWSVRTLSASPIQGAERLVATRMSGAPGQDLLVQDPSQKSVHILFGGNVAPGASKSLSLAPETAQDVTLSTAAEPVAVLPMRLGASALDGLVTLEAGMSAPSVQLTAPTATFTVTNNNDLGTGSLRYAINQSNAAPGLNLIQFNLPSGSLTITPASPLPAITVPVIIDGTTQPGYTFYTGPMVAVGGGAQGSGDVLTVNAGGSTIRGLEIRYAPQNGIALGVAGGDLVENCYVHNNNQAGIASNYVSDITIGGSAGASYNDIENNYPGIAINGGTNNIVSNNSIYGNGGDGIVFWGTASSVIGGATAGNLNVISGNQEGVYLNTGTGNSVLGNLIGVDYSGIADGNAGDGIVLDGELNATIGGASAAARNVIAANTGNGIYAYDQAAGAVISGNYIGVTIDGSTAMGNGGDGVTIDPGPPVASNVLVGGMTTGAGNVIAHNSGYGVNVASGSGNGILGNSIYTNASGAIRRAAGANNNQAAPVLSGAYDCSGSLQVLGTLAGAPNTAYTLEFFTNTACPGQARTLIGRDTVTTDGTGNAVIDSSLAVTPPANVRATATDPINNTSALSNCIDVATGPDLNVSFSAPSPATPQTGQTVTYVVTVQNTSGSVAATNATLTVNLPAGAAGYAFGGSTGTPTVTGTNPLVVTWGSIPAGTSYVFQYSVNYPTAGAYVTSASLAADQCDPSTIDNTASNTLNVYDPLAVTWSAVPTAAATGQAVAFTATATGGDGNYTYTFYPADGTGSSTSTTPTYSHTYATTGSFGTYVTVADGTGNSANSAVVTVNVTAPLTVSLATTPAAPVSGTVPLAVTFTATAAGGDGTYTYVLDPGDGTPPVTNATGTFNYTYNTAGNYTATLTVNDGAGRTASAAAAVSTQPTLTASLAAYPTHGTTGVDVSFVASATGGSGGYTYTLHRADGTGPVTNATGFFTHTYTTAGTYNAVVTVTDSDGNTQNATGPTVTVWDPLTVTASATTPTSGPVPLAMGFTATAAGGDGTYTYTWYMGDGHTIVDTATPSVPAYTYSVPGTYNVIVEVSDGSGHTATVTAPVVVTAQGVMNATLSATPIMGFAPLGVSFTPSATGGDGNYTYSFDYGDTTSGPGLVHTYTAAGTYHVVMTATDGSSPANTAMANVDIVVWDPLAVHLNAAVATPTSGLAPLTVNFRGVGSGGDTSQPYTWTWSWGDGTTSTSSGTSPAWRGHTFNTPGTYNVTVTMEDASGHKVTSNTIPVVAQADLGVGLSAYPTHGFRNLDVSFKAAAQGGAGGYSYALDPGDGSGTTTNATGNFTYTYATAGTYNATVTVTDSAANTQISTPVTITVWDPLTVTATAAPATTGAVPLTVNFSATPSGGDTSGYTYKWDFGNGNTATGATPTFTYNIPGTYTATVTVTDASGNMATSSPLQIVAQGVLSASLSATPMVGNAPLDVTFTGTAQGGVPPYTYTYHYDPSNADGLGHFTYNTPGTYNAYVHVEDSAGNTADSPAVPITVWAPLAVTASVTPTAGVVPFNADFTASATGGDGTYTYAWSFGDGSNATGATPSHMYNVAGTYSATVTVTDGHGHVATSAPVIVYAYEGMSVTLSATPTSGTAPLGVTFAATPQGGDGNYTYVFDYGDGNTGSDFNHIYTTPGTYTVTVTVTDTSSHTATSNPVTVNVYGPLSISAVATSPVTGTTPLTVDFSATPTGGDGNYTVRWDFGDGNTAAGLTASHTYNAAGVFSVTATVTDGQNNTATSTVIRITVFGPMSVSFSGTPVQGTVPLGVTFDAQASGGDGNYTYTIDYGDGSSGSAFNHTYTSAGTYTARVTATDHSGHTAMASVVINVWGPLTINAMATSSTSGVDPVLVNFAATATGGDGSYTFRWDFGDGNTATGATTTHIFNGEGQYTVTATVTDGHNHTVTSNRILITVYNRLKATFSATPTQGQTPLPVTFAVSAMGGDGNYTTTLNYGDGNTGTSLNHTYTSPGTYYASARVTDGSGHVYVTGTVLINVWNPLTVTAAPTGPVSGTVPLDTSFQAAVTGGDGNYTYHWSFDGILDPSQTGATATHTFTTPGQHYALVYVTDGHNNQGSSDHIQIMGIAPIGVILAAYPATGVTPLTVNFAPEVHGGTPPYTYDVDYGDGTNGPGTTHVYASAGTFQAKVTVTDANGDQGVSNTVPITVWNPVTVVSQATSATDGGYPLTVDFTATAQGGDNNYTYTWYFGDGAIASDTSTPSTPSHTYETPGVYYARVTVTDGHNHVVTGPDILIRVLKPVSVQVYANPVKLVVGNSVTFNAQAAGGDGNYTYVWDFGDQSTGLGQRVDHTFTDPGDYTVTVTATDGSSSSASATITIHVLPVPPQIVAAKKLSNPFRIKLFGSNFHANVSATINGTPVTTVVKTSSKIVLKQIKSLVPRGVPIQIVVTNLDDGGVSNTFLFVRTPAQ